VSETTTGSAAPTAGNPTEGYGTKPYRSYVLASLTLIYILNFVDRALLGVVAPVLKPDLGITDTQFGWLTGFAFAFLYTTVGIPIAQISETRSRVWILTICLALWSLMTALCGLSAEITIGGITIGAFWVLLTFRMGVGLGEAGCIPPANSIIADYYPPRKRSTALGFYAMGVTLGQVVANAVGGPVADAFGWRWAFFVLGVPGILLAIVFKLTVKEPPRGFSDPSGTVKAKASVKDAMAELSKKPTFWMVVIACTIAAFAGYGITQFQSLFLSRSFGMSPGEAGLQVNTPVFLLGSVGTLGCGWLAEKLGGRYPRSIAWLPALGLILCVPLYLLAFSAQSLTITTVCLIVAAMLKYTYLAAQYTIGQGVASARVRATATAILLFVVNLIGYGLGPPVAGALSDIIFKMLIADSPAAVGLVREMCEGAAKANLSQAQLEVCAIANPQSLEWSLMFSGSLYAFAALFFLLACRWLKKDMVAV